MNRWMKEQVFPLPAALISKYTLYSAEYMSKRPVAPARRILALRGDPLKKMSKSAHDPLSRIQLNDSPDLIRKKIQGATTDSQHQVGTTEHGISSAALSPGVENLLTILSSCTGEDRDVLAARYAGKKYKELKAAVADALIEHLTPIRQEFERYRGDQGYLAAVAQQGRDRASEIADGNLRTIKEQLGLGRI